LFDHYAEGFEQHLVEVLRYRAPNALAERLRIQGFHAQAALDLGCGTGLVAQAFAGLANVWDGVDLSAAMVSRAQASGRYRSVVQADLAAFLNSTDRHWDLVVAADVFIYVGALDEVFAGVARVLAPGGLFCFSVEEDSRAPFVLMPSLRYAHSQGSIINLAAQHGFNAPRCERGALREDQGVPTAGLYCWLRRGDE
jgi:predicted TPR repeat methyltransferase